MKTGTHHTKCAWNEDEDQRLLELVREMGPKEWTKIASVHGQGRSGKQCRERWSNHLDPSLKKSWWDPEEDRLIIETHEREGNIWSQMSKLLPGRPANAIKNHWNSTLKRAVQRVKKNITSSGEYEIQLPPAPKRSKNAEGEAEPVTIRVYLNANSSDSSRTVVVKEKPSRPKSVSTARPKTTSSRTKKNRVLTPTSDDDERILTRQERRKRKSRRDSSIDDETSQDSSQSPSLQEETNFERNKRVRLDDQLKKNQPSTTIIVPNVVTTGNDSMVTSTLGSSCTPDAPQPSSSMNTHHAFSSTLGSSCTPQVSSGLNHAFSSWSDPLETRTNTSISIGLTSFGEMDAFGDESKCVVDQQSCFGVDSSSWGAPWPTLGRHSSNASNTSQNNNLDPFDTYSNNVLAHLSTSF